MLRPRPPGCTTSQPSQRFFLTDRTHPTRNALTTGLIPEKRRNPTQNRGQISGGVQPICLFVGWGEFVDADGGGFEFCGA